MSGGMENETGEWAWSGKREPLEEADGISFTLTCQQRIIK